MEIDNKKKNEKKFQKIEEYIKNENKSIKDKIELSQKKMEGSIGKLTHRVNQRFNKVECI